MNTSSDAVDVALAEGGIALPTDLRTGILTAIDEQAPGPQPGFELAQLNIARFRFPMDHPEMSGFVEMLDPMNHQAEAAPGFVWRLTDEGSNDATSITFYDDPLLLVNVSVWADLEALRNYVYRSEHADMVKRRSEWATAPTARHVVLWWVPVGHTPSVSEADERLRLLEANGPTAEAFTFGQSFAAPTSDGATTE